MTWRRIYSRPHDLQTDYFGRCLWFTVNRWHRLKHLEIVPDGKGQADHFVVAEEWDALMQKLSREVLSPSQTIDMLKKKFSEYKADLLKSAHALHNARRLSSKVLLRTYREYMSRRIAYTYFFWLPWTINEVIDPWFQKQLQRRFPGRWQDLYEACTLACRANRMAVQQRELVRLKKPSHSRLHTHALKWGYLAVYTFNEPPWRWQDFARQRRMLIANNAVERSFRSLDTNRNRFSQALRVLRKDHQLARIAKIISHFNYLRTERVDVWREAIWQIQPFFREVERRFDLPRRTAPFLTPQEIERLLSKKVSLEKNRLVNRLKGKFILRIVNGSIDVEEHRSKIRVIKQTLFRTPQKEHIAGKSAYPGTVRGKVRIVRVLKDIENFPPNAILVSPMTHPDYILGIHKAAAIVTDEGGISCHAAIVARELKKPTVIGTKIATQVLADGDRVEVDATRGIVKKL